MHKIFRSVVVLLLVAGSASLAAAGDLKLTLANGRATLIAQDVPLRQILDEWARIGKTTIVNGDKLAGPPLTLQLIDLPEREVLDVLLRSASGYIVAQRAINVAGASQFDRVMILPVSRGPVGVVSSAPPPTQFGRPANVMQQMPMQMPVVDDDDPIETPQMVGPNNPNNPNNPNLNNPNSPNTPNNPQALPNIPAMQGPGSQPALTAPRPGMLSAPPPGQPNPYGPPGQVPPFVRPPGGPGGK